VIAARVFLRYKEAYTDVDAQQQSTSQQLAETAAKDNFLAQLEDKYMAQRPPMTADDFLGYIIEREMRN